MTTRIIKMPVAGVAGSLVSSHAYDQEQTFFNNVTKRVENALSSQTVGTGQDSFVQLPELQSAQGRNYTYLPKESDALRFLEAALQPQAIELDPTPAMPPPEFGAFIYDPVRPWDELSKRIAETMPGSADGSKNEVYRSQLLTLAKAKAEMDALGSQPDPTALDAIIQKYGIGFLSREEINTAAEWISGWKLYGNELKNSVESVIFQDATNGISITNEFLYNSRLIPSPYDGTKPSNEIVTNAEVRQTLKPGYFRAEYPAGWNVGIGLVKGDTLVKAYPFRVGYGRADLTSKIDEAYVEARATGARPYIVFSKEDPTAGSNSVISVILPDIPADGKTQITQGTVRPTVVSGV